jgi:hypothetical protein
MAKQGRKTILNQEMADAIINGLKLGNYMTTVADYVGVTPVSIANWLRKGEELSKVEDRELDEIEQLFVFFFFECKKARALSEMKALNVIQQASQSSWQAAAWYLERTASDRWGRVVRTEVTGADGGAIEINADAVNRKLEALLDKNVVDVEQDVVKSIAQTVSAQVDEVGDETTPDDE